MKVNNKRKSVAYHEAGHAVLALVLGRPVNRVEIDSTDGVRLGFIKNYTRHLESRAINEGDAEKLMRAAIPLMMILAAGRIAEKRIIGRNNWIGASSDNKYIVDLANKVSYGDRDEASALMKWIDKRVERILSMPLYWRNVELIANELLKKSKLTGKQVSELLKRNS